MEGIFKLLKHFVEIDTYKSLSECDVLFICHDVDRSLTLNKMAYSPLIDSILDDFQNQGLKCSSFSLPLSKLVGKKGYNYPYSANKLYLITRLISRIKFVSHLLEINFYEIILKKGKPKVVITIGSNPELAKSVKKIQSYHIEVLHGMGYERIEWGWEFLNAKELPHEIMTLDHTSFKVFKPLESKGVKISFIPHPFLRKFLGNHNIPSEWKLSPSKKYSKQILVSLQWGYSGEIKELSDILENGLYFRVIEDLIVKRPEILWRFRLHPFQNRQKKYSKTKKQMVSLTSKYENIEWVESTNLPIPSILELCIGHLTMSSMTSYEAAYFNVPTFALCPTLKPNGHFCNMFKDLVEKGILTKGEPEFETLNNWINLLGVREKRLSLNETDLYNKSINRIVKKIKSMYINPIDR